MVDYNSFDWQYQARIADLQDLAALDRLAGQGASAATLSRYAAARSAALTGRTRRSLWQRVAHRHQG